MNKPLWMRLAETGHISLSEPPAAGGGTPTPTPAPPATYVPPTGGGAAPAVFTQDDLNRVGAAEAAKAERRAKAEAAEEAARTLGVPVDEAARIIKAHQDAETAAKSEADRALAAANTEKAAAAADRAAAKAELHAARLERALTSLGVDPKALAAINVPGLTVDSTPEEIQVAVEKLKADVPSLFSVQAPVIPSADPQRPGQPLGQPPTGTLGGDGTKRFEQRFGEKAKV